MAWDLGLMWSLVLGNVYGTTWYAIKQGVVRNKIREEGDTGTTYGVLLRDFFLGEDRKHRQGDKAGD